MDVSVVVPTFNRRDLVLRNLETLFAQDYPSSRYEVIVVVDGATDGTVEALQTLRSSCQFRVIEQENRGPSAARNAGFREAEADLIVFVDDDMHCGPGLVAAHVTAHSAGDNIVGFGALFSSADSPPSLAQECFNREIGAYHLEHARVPGKPWKETECVFSNSSLPRQMLIDAGGFDEEFRKREDLELGIRLLSAGAKPRYISNAIAYQYYTKSAADLLVEAEAFAIADVMFARKHPEAQIQGHLNWIANEPHWKQKMRRIAAASPSLEKCLLAPLCSLGETFFHVSAFRNIGVRALQMRRRIHWVRVAQRLTES